MTALYFLLSENDGQVNLKILPLLKYIDKDKAYIKTYMSHSTNILNITYR